MIPCFTSACLCATDTHLDLPQASVYDWNVVAINCTYLKIATIRPSKLQNPPPAIDRTPPVPVFIALTAALMAMAGTFASEKLNFLYKDALHLSAPRVAALLLIAGIPAYIRPFMGASADLYPLFGYRRRSYFALACGVMALGYAGLAALDHYRYAAVLALVIVAGGGAIFAVVIADAVMVAVGNANGTVGRLQSIQRGIPLVLSLMFAARLSGFVTQHWSYRACFAAASILSALAAPLAMLIPERRRRNAAVPTASGKPNVITDRAAVASALRNAARTPGLWAVVAFVFYLIGTPGTSTAQFYFMVDVLHFSKQLIGNLGMAGSAGSIMGLLTFAAVSRRLPVRAMVWGAYLCDCAVYLVSLGLHDTASAYAVIFVHSGITSIYMLCLYTLAARACPPGIEGAIYGLVLASISLANNLSEILGASIYDRYGPASHHAIAFGWHALLWFGFAFTAVAVVFIPFLPKWTKSVEPRHADT